MFKSSCVVCCVFPCYVDTSCSSCPGLLRLLFGQIQASDLQQGLRVSRLGHCPRLDSGLGLHDLHPHGGRHQDHPVRRATYRGGWTDGPSGLSTTHLDATSEAFSCLLSTEDQGGGRSSPWRRQFTSQRAHLPTGPQWEQWWAEGANPHHCRDHDVKEQGGGSP